MDPMTGTMSTAGEGPKGLVLACKFPEKNSGLIIHEDMECITLSILHGQNQDAHVQDHRPHLIQNGEVYPLQCSCHHWASHDLS